MKQIKLISKIYNKTLIKSKFGTYTSNKNILYFNNIPKTIKLSQYNYSTKNNDELEISENKEKIENKDIISGSDLSSSDSESSSGDKLPSKKKQGELESDLSGSDLSGSDFDSSDLSGSDFSGSDFSGSDFSGSDLSDSDLSGSDSGSGSDESGSDSGSSSDESGSDSSSGSGSDDGSNKSIDSEVVPIGGGKKGASGAPKLTDREKRTQKLLAGKSREEKRDILVSMNGESTKVERDPYLDKSKLREKFDIVRTKHKEEAKDPSNILDLKRSAVIEKTGSELLDTPIQKLHRKQIKDTKSLVKEFKSKNLEVEEKKMKKKIAQRYFDNEVEEQLESEEQFIERFQKFQTLNVKDVFLPGQFDIKKELVRPVFIGTSREDFTRENLLDAFKRALPHFRNNPQLLNDSFIALVYFCTAEVAHDWEDSDYLKLAEEVFSTSQPSEFEKNKLVSNMEERLRTHYKNKPEKVMRLLEEYKKSLIPMTQEELELENEKLYQEFPELRPTEKKSLEMLQTDEDTSKKTMEDEFLGLDKLHLTQLDAKPVINFWIGLEESDFLKLLPEGYPSKSRLALACKSLREVGCSHPYSLMWTQYCSHLLDQLLQRQKSNFLKSKSPNGAGGLLIDGIKGIGKSCTLAELAMWARTNGWLVVYVDGRDMTEIGNCYPSKKDRNLFDQPRVAVKLCKDQIAANGNILSQLPLRGTLSPSIIEGLKPTSTSTLLDLLNFGAANQLSATEVFEEFRMQLNMVSEFPVLLAVDSFDRFHTFSHFTDRLSLSYNPKHIHANRLVLCRLFSDFDNHGLINGTFLGAFTSGKPKSDWLKLHGSQHTFTLHPWNLKEISSTMEFWKKIKYYRDVSANKAVYQYFLTLSSGIGSEAFRIIKPL